MFHKCETIESLCYLRTVLYSNFLSICIHVSNGEEKFSATYSNVWCGIYIECGRYVSLWAPSTTVSNFFSFDVHYTLLHYRLLFVSLDILCCRKVVSSIHYSFWGIYDKLMYGTYASSRYLVTWSNSLKNLSRNQDQWKKLYRTTVRPFGQIQKTENRWQQQFVDQGSGTRSLGHRDPQRFCAHALAKNRTRPSSGDRLFYPTHFCLE